MMTRVFAFRWNTESTKADTNLWVVEHSPTNLNQSVFRPSALRVGSRERPYRCHRLEVTGGWPAPSEVLEGRSLGDPAEGLAWACPVVRIGQAAAGDQGST